MKNVPLAVNSAVEVAATVVAAETVEIAAIVAAAVTSAGKLSFAGRSPGGFGLSFPDDLPFALSVMRRNRVALFLLATRLKAAIWVIW